MPVVIDHRRREVSVSTARLSRAVQRALEAVGRPAGEVEVTLVGDVAFGDGDLGAKLLGGLDEIVAAGAAPIRVLMQHSEAL